MNRAFLYNVSANVMTFFLMMLMSVCLTPYIVHTLGVEAFGLIHLTQNMINYLSVITASLSAVVVRFFSVAAHKGEMEQAQRYLASYFVSSLFLSIGLFLLCLFMSQQLVDWLHVPAHLAKDTQIAFVLGGLLFMLNFVMSGIGAAPFYANKLYVSSVGQAIQMFGRALVIVLLFTVTTPAIWHIPLAAVMGSFAALGMGLYYFKKLIPWFSFKWRYVSLSSSLTLVRSGVWHSFEQMGILLFLQIDLLMTNLLIGAEATGQYAAILQFPLLLRTLAGTLAVVFAPTITKLYSNQDEQGLIQYAANAMKWSGLFVAFPAALLGGLAGPLMLLWLGPAFEELKWLLMIHAAYLCFTLMFLPLTYVPTAFNRFKVPAVVTLILGGSNVLLAYGLTHLLQLGLYGIASAGAVVLLMKNIVFLPLYTAKITKQKSTIFYKHTVVPLFGALFIWGICAGIQAVYDVTRWWELFCIGGICFVLYLGYLYQFAGTKQERIQLMRKVKQAAIERSVSR
ncbi:MATE family efflux transporter [Bacillus altitudinis]|uniref:MATE family efflux transporter n=1 Tax=Bacillus altitudinis TaxID=293387 RepID=UPI00203E9250|nr:MATE family efflux transporter [Bacillus altitudinis]MCM3043512.1 MATE family efflux transporter [Bacillus altitudinis]MEC1803285.1 MATE family efflux transporter [Bacillus altitudinis]